MISVSLGKCTFSAAAGYGAGKLTKKRSNAPDFHPQHAVHEHRGLPVSTTEHRAIDLIGSPRRENKGKDFKAMTPPTVTRLEPNWRWTKEFGVLPGVKLGHLIHTCGIIPLDAHGELVGRDDVRAQIRKVFENISEVLSAGGCTLANIVKLTIFLKDLADFDALKEVRREFFPDGVPGVVTTVGADLLGDGIRVEIEASAVANSDG